MSSTLNHPDVSSLLQQLEAVRAQGKAEERIALKKKMRCTMEGRKSGWRDTSGNEEIIMTARRGLIREHIAKVAIMKQMGLENIPTFAVVWNEYMERNNENHHKKKCTISNCTGAH